MFSTRTSPEWRDDMPRTFSRSDTPPHVPVVPQRRRSFATALLIPRLVALVTKH